MEISMGRNEKIKVCKIIAILFCAVVFTTSCNTLNTFNYKQVSCDFDYMVEEEDMVLDTLKYILNKEYENDTCIIRAYAAYYNVAEKKRYFFKTIHYKKTGIDKLIKYYPDFKIRYAFFTFMDTEVGKVFDFDENGKFLREINHEKDCNVNFEQIYYICSKEEIPLSVGYADTWSVDYTEIYKKQDPQTGHWYWIIQYHKTLYSQYLQLKIDGETGEIIDRQNMQIVTGEGLSQTETNVIDEQQPVKKEGFWKKNFGI